MSTLRSIAYLLLSCAFLAGWLLLLIAAPERGWSAAWVFPALVALFAGFVIASGRFAHWYCKTPPR